MDSIDFIFLILILVCFIEVQVSFVLSIISFNRSKPTPIPEVGLTEEEAARQAAEEIKEEARRERLNSKGYKDWAKELRELA